MPVAIAILLGVVEGLTEYLPVSSTGHLILAGHWLGLSDDDPATSAFEVVVQFGAILAVVAHYRTLLAERLAGLFARDPASLRLLAAVAVAFAPAAVVGLLFRKAIKAHLFGPAPVAVALIVGGIAMIVVERALRARRSAASGDSLGDVTLRRAFAIGVGQCFSLFPGMSRSMCTILAGEIAGLSAATSAEFSFLLALPTLTAAAALEAYKGREVLAEHVGGASLSIGLVVSFVVAWGVIASFLRYLRSHGLEPFGWYRIALGAVVFWAVGQ
ncbi:MAG: undecaprenyl-diphosphate phosphatase [Polyangiaceae bacterium]|nr:undecaprenyl-diphosphate phosphatase [Polyangiaceae bacterium]